MSKFTEDAKLLLEYIGGKDNIKAVTHCVTRMRFVLIDEKKADVKKIESLKSAKGTFTQAGQFQVIIGNEVSEFYNEFNQTFVQKLMANLAEIFTNYSVNNYCIFCLFVISAKF